MGLWAEQFTIISPVVHRRKNVIQILCYGKLGVARVFSSQWKFTRPSSIYFSVGIARDIVPLVINYLEVKNSSF